jgi:hypothetical protein
VTSGRLVAEHYDHNPAITPEADFAELHGAAR